MQADIRWLDCPDVFRVNRLDAHSDHRFFETEESYRSKNQTLKQSLNGTWEFYYSTNAKERPIGFYEEGFDLSGFDKIEVPQHIEMAGYDKIHYINTCLLYTSAAKFYKTMVFMPYIINGVAIAYAFSYFFSPINGAFDAILTGAGLEGWIRNWLSDPKIVNYVLSFVSLWRFSGYHVILFMAALQSLPQDIEEAARVDGANTWQLFKYIQVPSIMLMVDFVLFDNIRGALQVFDIPFVMTAGGPGYASSTFTLYTICLLYTSKYFLYSLVIRFMQQVWRRLCFQQV